MKISTGYFARASTNGPRGKHTKVHLVDENLKPLCGYKPHDTMRYHFNATNIVLSYVECDKCKDELKYQYKITPEEDMGKLCHMVHFYENKLVLSMKDIIKNCDRLFTDENEAKEWAKNCVRLFRKFMKNANRIAV